MQGYLTTHILDTARGAPAEGVRISLFRIEVDARVHLGDAVTNADGRTDTPVLSKERFRQGVYELVFHTGPYLDRIGVAEEHPRFLSDIPIRFGMSEDSHYHVPLLLSPFGYSTYRGS